jgi:DNA-binding MarR family transcriptional regulator
MQQTKLLSPAAGQAWVRLMRTAPALLQAVQDDMKRQGFPPLEWYDVLLELGRHPDRRSRQRDLGQRLSIARYNLSRLLERIEKAALVVRTPSPGDARGADVALTGEGWALRQRMWPAYAAALERRVEQRLTEAELTTLAGLLFRLQPD